jgi:hypothetical protein
MAEPQRRRHRHRRPCGRRQLRDGLCGPAAVHHGGPRRAGSGGRADRGHRRRFLCARQAVERLVQRSHPVAQAHGGRRLRSHSLRSRPAGRHHELAAGRHRAIPRVDGTRPAAADPLRDARRLRREERPGQGVRVPRGARYGRRAHRAGGRFPLAVSGQRVSNHLCGGADTPESSAWCCSRSSPGIRGGSAPSPFRSEFRCHPVSGA